MAKKYTRGAKRASKPLSSKAKSSSKYKLPAKGKASAKKKAKTTTKKRVSYKQEYIKLLEKTNKTFSKEIKAIRKAIQPEADGVPSVKPQFVATGKGKRSESTIATINDVVEQLNNLQTEIAQRNIMLGELMNQPGKI
jgi:predicted component of type VI protein secretion system